jgi:hypothetical protein
LDSAIPLLVAAEICASSVGRWRHAASLIRRRREASVSFWPRRTVEPTEAGWHKTLGNIVEEPRRRRSHVARWHVVHGFRRRHTTRREVRGKHVWHGRVTPGTSGESWGRNHRAPLLWWLRLRWLLLWRRLHGPAALQPTRWHLLLEPRWRWRALQDLRWLVCSRLSVDMKGILHGAKARGRGRAHLSGRATAIASIVYVTIARLGHLTLLLSLLRKAHHGRL